MKPAAKVIDMQRKRQARLVLREFDKQAHERRSDLEQKRSDVERKARNQF